MKIKSLIVAAVVALFATSSLSAKSLVVYFSRADENYGVGNITEGNTAILANPSAPPTQSDGMNHAIKSPLIIRNGAQSKTPRFTIICMIR